MSHKTDCLRVYECGWPMHRFGRAHDGGYVMALTGVIPDYFLSGGISDDCSFELAVLDWYPQLVCDAYDHSSGPAGSHPRYRFYREPVTCGSFGHKNALVKLDIEGDEWPWLDSIGADIVNIYQMVAELHTPHGSRWSWDALHRLSNTHALIHAHANNMDGIVDIDGVRVPGTLETTWLRWDVYHSSTLVVWVNIQNIPGPLDMPNDPNKPDHIIDWPPFVSK